MPSSSSLTAVTREFGKTAEAGLRGSSQVRALNAILFMKKFFDGFDDFARI